MDFCVLISSRVKKNFTINPHYIEFRITNHPYVRLIACLPTFKRFMTQKSHVAQLTGQIRRKRESFI